MAKYRALTQADRATEPREEGQTIDRARSGENGTGSQRRGRASGELEKGSRERAQATGLADLEGEGFRIREK